MIGDRNSQKCVSQCIYYVKSLYTDFDNFARGLRAIKSVLRVAGDFKRNEPEVSELALLFRALRDFNIPKIVGDDWIVFNGLLGDLFPGIDIPRQRNWDNEKVISEVCSCQLASFATL